MRRCLLPFVLLVTACAHAAVSVDRKALLLSDKAPPREGCRVSFNPDPLPSLTKLADSTSLVAAVAQYARQYPINTGRMYALYSAVFDEDGRLSKLQSIDYFLPQGRADAFAEIVRQSLRRQPAVAFSVRLLVEPLAAVPVIVGRSERCVPQSLTRFELTAPGGMSVDRPQPVRLQMWVLADGSGHVLSVLRSSGSSDLDEWVVKTLESYKFLPGLVDGFPYPMEHEATVSIRTR